MTILVMLFTFILFDGYLTRKIPAYDQCVEKCGKDPLDDAVQKRVFDECRDDCIEAELADCLAQAGDTATKKKCTQEALKRCIENCVEDPFCIRFCNTVYH
ncbi:hypothetical protein CSKR_102999 [Clonorchis sinensis]|uniref:Uncharacterized protein n=1 Tax=Clonorchis sinensis TaxID=79923 RepID=A0A8T1MXA4_CLOSI|nr:hypothetical protein CSKR_102999 [Clonorchis sinensis]